MKFKAKSKMKIILGLFFWLICYEISFPQNDGFITISGRNIITPDNRPLLLKGINLGNWLVPEGYMFKFDSATSPRLINKVINELIGLDEAKIFWKTFKDNYINRDDIKFIKEKGFNSIRLPFTWKLFASEDNPDYFDDSAFKIFDKIVAWCSEYKIYIIFDMHCAPAGQTGDNIDDSWGYPYLFLSENYQNITAKIWKAIAERYKEEKIVIGYDLLNEPIAHFHDTLELNPKLVPLYQKITKSIREVDKNHIIFLGGSQWNSNFSHFNDLFDDKTVFTFHVYWTDTTQQVIQKYIDLRNKFNIPIWLGESGENTNEWINSFRILLEKNNIGWCFWPFKKISSKSCILSIDKPFEYDKIIEFANKPRATFRELREIRPPFEYSKQILNQLLENCKFKNCKINEGFLKALGF